MPVFGSNNGVFRTNLNRTRVSDIITVQELKQSYLFGVPIVDGRNIELSDEVFQLYIDNAISDLEHKLDIFITPTQIEEDRDYSFNQYADWGSFYLDNIPVLQIDSIEVIAYKDELGAPQIVQTIPNSWIRLSPHDGVVRLSPNTRSASHLQINSVNGFFPQIFKLNHVPHLWKLKYVAGFAHGKVPVLVNQAIGLLAAIQALIVAGNLVLGAGIASQALSLDGLSQSITTTASAENSSYSATIKEYQNLLFGSRMNDDTAIINKLAAYYNRRGVSVI